MNSNQAKPNHAKSSSQRNDRVTRQGWILWGVMALGMLGLAAAVMLLYFPMLHSEGGSTPRSFEQAYYVLVGLTGLVVVFCLFTALRHRELNALRGIVAREELETEDARDRKSVV